MTSLRCPKLCWSPARQAVVEQMASQSHPLYQLAKNNAALAAAGHPRYADDGGWAAFLCLLDPATYAPQVWQRFVLTTKLGVPITDIATFPYFPERFNWLEELVWYSWACPYFTDEQVGIFVGNMNLIVRALLGFLPGETVPRSVNCNNVNGLANTYFPAAIVDMLPENPYRNTILGKTTIINYNKPQALGGLDPSPAGSTVRDIFEGWWGPGRFVDGGGWMEDGEYHENTPVYVTMGVESIRSLTGKDHFPTWGAHYRDLARVAAVSYSADMKPLQYGDVDSQFAGVVRWPLLWESWGMLTGMAAGSPEAANLQALLTSTPAWQGLPNERPDNPGERTMVWFNPYATAKAAPLPCAVAAKGMGYGRYKSSGTLAAANCPPARAVDHAMFWAGARWLYRRGEWLLGTPVGYGLGPDAPQQFPEAVNSSGVAGLTAFGTRVVDAAITTSDGGFYCAGHNGGPMYGPNNGKQPPAFIHDHRYRIRFLPGPCAFVSCVTWDCQDPTALPGWGGPTWERETTARVAKMLAYGLCQNVVHSPVAPTLTGVGPAWLTAGGQQMNVSVLTPYSANVVDGDTFWPDPSPYPPGRKGYLTFLTPPAFPDKGRHFASMITVEQPDRASAILVGGADIGVSRVLVMNPAGGENALLLFPTEQFYPRFQTALTASVQFPVGGPLVCACGLDPARHWAVDVDGAAPRPLTLFDDGYAEFRLGESGAHTLSFACDGGAPVPYDPWP